MQSIVAEHPELAEVVSLYGDGLTVQAYRQGIRLLGPIQTWTGISTRLFAGRMAINLGGDALGRRILVSVYRAARTHPRAILAFARLRAEDRGPIEALGFCKRAAPRMQNIPADDLASWLSFRASLYAMARDFDTADELFAQIPENERDNNWIRVERSMRLEEEDRYAEALAVVQEALSKEPFDRPAVQAAAKFLTLLDREDEAIQLLSEAAERIESCVLMHQLAYTLNSAGRYAEALDALDRYMELAPLREDEKDGISLTRADLANKLGDRAAAARHFRASGNPTASLIADRLEAAPAEARRVCLDVPFVRQHHKTCVPATLTAISRFHGRPANHLEIAEKICYDGTSNYSQRQWAEESGWHAREFTLTWDAAVALIDRGMPVTLATTAVGNAHLQAIAGYDAAARTLIFRDPYYTVLRDALMPELLENQRANGPRAMVLVPEGNEDALDGIELPDSALYDIAFRLQAALERHDRDTAWTEYETLQSLSPSDDHPIVIDARLSIARYDGDRTEQLARYERRVTLFPEDGNAQLARIHLLRELAPRARTVAALESLCDGWDRPTDGAARGGADNEPDTASDETAWSDIQPQARFHPFYLREYANELRTDARQHVKAIRLLRRVLRGNPLDDSSLSSLAAVHWDQRRFDRALELHQFAHCLDGADERNAWLYFVSARSMGKTEEALHRLRRRFERVGARSPNPARTFVHALFTLDRAPEAFAALDQAMNLRPADGEMALYAAEWHARFGKFERARALLAETAAGRVGAARRRHALADIARREGQLEEALDHWRTLIALEPLHLEAHREAARLVQHLEGDEAAHRHFAVVAQRFPHHFGLRAVWAGLLRDMPEMEEARWAVLERMVVLNPNDAWCRRERAITLTELRKPLEALAEAKIAIDLEPTEGSGYSVLGTVYSHQARLSDAREAFRTAIRLSVDDGYSISEAMRLCDTPTQERETLRLIEAELTVQISDGTGILAYRDAASKVLPAEETLASLHRLLTARPDLWQAWSATIAALRSAVRTEEALTFARLAIERFPMVPELWLDTAAVHRTRGATTEQRAAIAEALQLRPFWPAAIQDLCRSYESTGETAEAMELLRGAVLRDPQNASLRWWLAQSLHRAGLKAEAIDQMKMACRIYPAAVWSWDRLATWCGAQDRGAEPAALARELLVRRPHHAPLHFQLARLLPADAAHQAERLSLLDRAVHLQPRFYEAHELRAEMLAASGDYRRALSALKSSDGLPAPAQLQLIAADIEARFGGGPTVALPRLQALLRNEPGFVEGWARLANWQRARGAAGAPGYLEAARKLVELQPQNCRTWGFLGEASERMGDAAAAEAAYRRAFLIDPEYSFASGALVELLLGADRLDEAAALIQSLDPTARDAGTLVRSCRLHLKRRDNAAAVEALCSLCKLPEDGNEYHHEILPQLLAAPGAAHLLAQSLGALLSAGTPVRAEAGPIFVRAGLASGNRPLTEQWIAFLQGQGEIGIRATVAFIEHLAEVRDSAALPRLMREKAAYLRASNQTWSALANALSKAHDSAAVLKWTEDWQQRTGLDAGMLLSRATALRATGRRHEAVALAQHALGLPDAYGARSRHALWLATEAALAGSTEAAARYLHIAGTEIAGNAPFFQFQSHLITALLRVQQSSAPQRNAAFQSAKELLRQARAAYPQLKASSLHTEIYVQTVKRIAADVGGPLAQGWMLTAVRL